MRVLKLLQANLLRYDLEEKKVVQFLADYCLSGTILDVGCGYGRVLELLSPDRYEAVGVDLNPAIVAACQAKGLNCLTPTDLENSTHSKFDAILMLHVIEHMNPDECFKFMDAYLDKLKDGGILIIATPILTEYFFEDFDHIKPYYPAGINMVFSGDGAQVQYYSRNKLRMVDLWYKKYFYRWTNAKFIYFPGNRFIQVFSKLLFALLFKISFGVVGRKDGWVGVFCKSQ